MYLRALAIEEKSLGSEHPDVAATRHDLGALYKSLGRYEEAGFVVNPVVWEVGLNGVRQDGVYGFEIADELTPGAGTHEPRR